MRKMQTPNASNASSALNNPSAPSSPGAPAPYLQATGELPFTLTNDYMFRAFLQTNNNVLRHLTCSLLRLRPEEVEEVRIENPIEMGKTPGDKEFVLDVKISLNNRRIINYEMQVIPRGDWPERSLVYLCRQFDSLHKGDAYTKIEPVTHIGFLGFTLFKDKPEFYATYKMLNVRNHNLYSDKFTLGVVDLTQIELATEEDREWRTDYWASLFKATTWEEVKRMAEKDTIMEDAADTLHRLLQDDRVREQCWAREDYYRTIKWYEDTQKEQAAALVEKDVALAEQAAEIVEKDAEIARLRRLLEEKQGKNL
ncbi:MAG: Rpn family recombination-promoting nuclease/putative transposase [Roseburia sp.]|nr:Rpn family recombination-promoting nuclease/putative transposase [Roseburia sp.]MCM1097912.1 Rpn family recombination-promoting nuclease/putative transposase [Ruminococcus flavefaciens]